MNVSDDNILCILVTREKKVWWYGQLSHSVYVKELTGTLSRRPFGCSGVVQIQATVVVYHHIRVRLIIRTCHPSDQWSVMPGFHHSVAVLPFPLRKFWKNYISTVRFTLLTWKITLRRCHLPLCRNCRSIAIGSNPISAVGGQPISFLVTSSLCIRRRFQHFCFHPQRQR